KEGHIAPALQDDVDVWIGRGRRRVDLYFEGVRREDRVGDVAVRRAGPGDDLLLEIELDRPVDRRDRELRGTYRVDRPRSLGRPSLEAVRRIAARNLRD